MKCDEYATQVFCETFANIDKLHSYEVCTQIVTHLPRVTIQAFSSIDREMC